MLAPMVGTVEISTIRSIHSHFTAVRCHFVAHKRPFEVRDIMGGSQGAISHSTFTNQRACMNNGVYCGYIICYEMRLQMHFNV